MGLAASQARLLSITARLSNNELHSQQLANSKIRLADRTQEASADYIDALNASQLTLTTYDGKGNATSVALTPSVLYTYSDFKNQYGISNTSGQLLISTTDFQHYQASNNMFEFIESYGISLNDNDEYVNKMTHLYGENYAEIFDSRTNKVKDNFNFDLRIIPDWANEIPDFNYVSKENYNAWKNEVQQLLPNQNENIGGLYGDIIDTLSALPEYTPDFSSLANVYNGKVCHSLAERNKNTTEGVYHIEHNLYALIWGPDGLGGNGVLPEDPQISYDDSDYLFNDKTKKLYNSDESIIISTNMNNTYYDDNLTITGGTDCNDAARSAANALKSGLKGSEEFSAVKELKQLIIDTYCDAIAYLCANGTDTQKPKSEYGFAAISGTTSKTATEIYMQWEEIYSRLASLNANIKSEWVDKCEYVTTASQQLNNAYQNYYELIPDQKIIENSNTQAKWYENLWHRINGTSDYKDQTVLNYENGNLESGKYFKVLDDNLLTSKDWLKFALEQGIVTLEQVQTQDIVDDAEGLDGRAWKAVIYTSCTDIVSQVDEVAIAKAEAEYTKTLKEIESEDKKLDNDIKKLDTEHSALATEHDSIKEVLKKNIENSFKAFS